MSPRAFLGHSLLGLAILSVLFSAFFVEPLGAQVGAGGTKEAPCLLSLKVSPPGWTAWLDGRPLETRPGPNGSRLASIGRGWHDLLLLADGCVAGHRAILASGPGFDLETRLEVAGSSLVFQALAPTGPRPKSCRFSPDGRYIVAPLLSGPGADVLDAESLRSLGRLEPPPAYAKAEGFVESVFLPALGEVWVSQMHNSTIHSFDAASLAWKASFPSGGSYPKVLCPSVDGSLVFVSNWVSEDICVLEAASHRLLRRIRTGSIPRGLAASPDGKDLYIALFGDGAILDLDLATWRLSTFWKADGGAKRHLLIDPARGRLYATDMARDSLFAFDLASKRLLAEVPVGSNPNTCAASPGAGLIYVCTRGPNGDQGYELPGPVAGELVAVDAQSLRVVARQWGGNQPTGLDVAAVGGKIVMSDFLDARVEVFAFQAPARRSPTYLRKGL